MPRLIGKRIILREYRKEDLTSIRKWCNDAEITDQLSDIFLYPQTLNQTEQFLNAVLEGSGEHKGFVIAHKENEAYIGQIDLIHIDWKNRSARLGIVIGVKELLGQGFGEEAICLLQEYVFRRLNLNRLELDVHDYNTRAIRCYAKCGFKEEGVLRQKFYINGSYTDLIPMSILREEWEAGLGSNGGV